MMQTRAEIIVKALMKIPNSVITGGPFTTRQQLIQAGLLKPNPELRTQYLEGVPSPNRHQPWFKDEPCLCLDDTARLLIVFEMNDAHLQGIENETIWYYIRLPLLPLRWLAPLVRPKPPEYPYGHLYNDDDEIDRTGGGY